MKNTCRVTALLLAVLMLGGCSEPTPAAITFDPESAQTASFTAEAETRKVTRSETFRNADDSAEICVHIDTELSMAPMPVIEASPMELTAQDAHDIIYAFFPEAECYEGHPKYCSEETSWTKETLEKEMERWRSYSYEDLAEIWGGVDQLPQAMRPNGEDIPFVEYWEEAMAYYEKLLEKVPEEDRRTPSLWHMFKETEYREEPEEAARMDLSKDRDCVMANVMVGEDRYYYVVASGNPLFGTSNLISLSYDTQDSPASVDWQIFLSENEKLPAPSQEDLDRALEVAQSYLDRFPIGQWILEEPQPSGHDGTIYISGHPADTKLPDADSVVMNMTPLEMPRMSIRVHPDGRLLSFLVGGSLTDVVTHTEKAAELPVDTLLETGLNHLRSRKTMAYGIDEEALVWEQIWAEEDFLCRVDVTGLTRGFSRVNTPEGGICYVPSLTLNGTVAYTGKETGEYFDPEKASFLPAGEIPLVIVNAIDGTILSL